MDTRGEWLKAELCMIVVADMRIFGYIGSASCLLWVPYCSCNIPYIHYRYRNIVVTLTSITLCMLPAVEIPTCAR